MILRPPRSTPKPSSAASDVYKSQNQHVPEDLGFEYGDAVPISARTGMGFELLLARLGEKLETAMVDVELLIPYRDGYLIPFFHENGKADRVEHCEDGVIISGRLARRCLSKFVEYVKLINPSPFQPVGQTTLIGRLPIRGPFHVL